MSALPKPNKFNVNVSLQEVEKTFPTISRTLALLISERRQNLRKWLGASGENPIQGYCAKSWGNPTKDYPVAPLRKQFFELLLSLVWTRKHKSDEMDAVLDALVVPCPGKEHDGLTRWVANEFVPFWVNVKDAYPDFFDKCSRKSRRCCGILPFTNPTESGAQTSSTDEYDTGPTLNSYTETRMVAFTSSVATIIACLLPTLAIAALSKLQQTAEILGVIAVFTAIFAIGLMFMTGGGTSRVEIFTATAA